VVPVVGRHVGLDPSVPADQVAEGVAESISAAGHPELEVVLAFGADVPDEFAEQFKAVIDQAARVVRCVSHTSWATVANTGAVRSDAAFVLFLDPGVRVTAPGWAATLVAHAAGNRIGAVAARLVRPGDVLEQAGYGLVAGEPIELLRGLPATTTAYAGAALVPGERSAITTRCTAVSSARFAEVGGFSSTYTTALHDVDLCLKLRLAGYRNIYQPAVSAQWSGEVRPLGYDDDLDRLQQRWGGYLRNDPYVNPSLIGAEWLTRH
jgi:hypothetical protein